MRGILSIGYRVQNGRPQNRFACRNDAESQGLPARRLTHYALGQTPEASSLSPILIKIASSYDRAEAASIKPGNALRLGRDASLKLQASSLKPDSHRLLRRRTGAEAAGLKPQATSLELTLIEIASSWDSSQRQRRTRIPRLNHQEGGEGNSKSQNPTNSRFPDYNSIPFGPWSLVPWDLVGVWGLGFVSQRSWRPWRFNVRIQSLPRI